MVFPLTRPRIAAVATFALAAGCQPRGTAKPAAPSAQSADAASSRESPRSDSRSVLPDILDRFCGRPAGPAPILVKVLKDSAGDIGGYTYNRRILDSPIYYLDAQGKEYAMFHIFGSDAEKARNAPLIDSLRKAYPVEEDLICPEGTRSP